MEIKLRDYQEECLQAIEDAGPGKWLCSLCVGLGKTVIFTQMKRRGRVLVLAHKRDLITQPVKFYDCPVGIEMADKTSNGEEVVIASMQSMVKRLDKFSPDDFDVIILDEAHRAASDSYRTIFNYFKPRQLLGFTGTAYRADGKDLSEFFDEVIYEKDIIFGIKNGYLAPVECHRVDVGYDLSNIRKRVGDLSLSDLAKETNIETANKAIAEIYHKFPKPCLIFAVNQAHAEAIADEIGEDAVVITSKTKKAEERLEDARRGDIPCVITVIKLSEGTDIPCIRTGIMARPTLSLNIFVQSAGRQLRTHKPLTMLLEKYKSDRLTMKILFIPRHKKDIDVIKRQLSEKGVINVTVSCDAGRDLFDIVEERVEPDKEKAYLIDCVGNTGRHNICTAPCLIGLTDEDVPKAKQIDLIGDLLMDLPDLIVEKSDCPDSWVKNMKKVDIFAKSNNYNLHSVNYTRHPDGAMIVNLTKGRWIGVKKVDPAGNTVVISSKGIRRPMKAQEAFDYIFEMLCKNAGEIEPLWNKNSIKRWGRKPPSLAQSRLCSTLLRTAGVHYNIHGKTSGELSCIINRLKLDNIKK